VHVLMLESSDISLPLRHWLATTGGAQVTPHFDPLSIQVCEALHPDMVVSYNYRHIIRPDVVERMRGRAVNLHISYLPWNRGAHPNVWSFLEDTPKGVTIHLVDEGVDTGGILVQRELQFDPAKETFQTSYQKLHAEIQRLFIESWDRLRTFSVPAQPQDPHEGSKHYARGLDELMKIFGSNLWTTPVAEVRQRYRGAAS